MLFGGLHLFGRPELPNQPELSISAALTAEVQKWRYPHHRKQENNNSSFSSTFFVLCTAPSPLRFRTLVESTLSIYILRMTSFILIHFFLPAPRVLRLEDPNRANPTRSPRTHLLSTPEKKNGQKTERKRRANRFRNRVGFLSHVQQKASDDDRLLCVCVCGACFSVLSCHHHPPPRYHHHHHQRGG
jgi:hypothetical protein